MHRYLVFAFVAAIGCGEGPGIRDALPPPDLASPRQIDNPIQTDVIAQIQPPIIDVLWVIDNSCSMSCIVGCHTGGVTGSVTDEIVANFPLFIKHFKDSGVDYHIGVVTTDGDNPAEDGKLQPGLGNLWVDPTTPNEVLAFEAMAVKGTGTDGSGNEKGLSAAYRSYEEHGDTFNDGFFRDTSSLHMIAFSNEDDKTPDATITPAEFVSWYGNLRTPDKRKFHSVVCLDEASEACRLERGKRYIQVTHEIGGVIWDIEEIPYNTLLDGLGAQAAGLASEYYLTQVPVPGTLEVTIDDADSGGRIDFEEVEADSTEVGYYYSPTRNSVLFVNYLPTPRSRIELTYERAAANYGQPDNQ